MSTVNFKVSGDSAGSTLFKARARQFEIPVDEPPSLGGADAAPNPVEYILAGYAGCLNVVLHLVAEQRKVVLNGLHLEIDGDINPAKLFGSETTSRAGFETIRVKAVIDSAAPSVVLESIWEDALSRCPVNDNLGNTTPVIHQLVIPTLN
jgi:uncharacterized OsmC-like protein